MNCSGPRKKAILYASSEDEPNEECRKRYGKNYVGQAELIKDIFLVKKELPKSNLSKTIKESNMPTAYKNALFRFGIKEWNELVAIYKRNYKFNILGIGLKGEGILKNELQIRKLI